MSWVALEHVSKTYVGGNTAPVLVDFNLRIAKGEFVCLVGKNGCGKTTLLELIAGFVRPDSGRIRVGNSDVCGPGISRAIVCVDDVLFPWLTLRGNIEFGLRAAVKPPSASRISALVDALELGDVLDYRPHQVSTGFRRRASIARALAVARDAVLLDESFSSLDPDARERLYDETLKWWQASGTTMLLATHNLAEAVRLGTAVLLLSGQPLHVSQTFRPAGDPLSASRKEVLRHEVGRLAALCSDNSLTA